MMKKLTISTFATILLGELLAFTILILQTGKTDYMWISVVAISMMLIVTTYYFCCKLKDFFIEREEKKRLQENENFQKTYQIYNTIIDTVKRNNEDLSGQIISLATIQKEMINDNKMLCQKLEESVNEINKNNGSRIHEIKENIDHLNDILKDNVAESNRVFSDKLENLSDKTDSYVGLIKEENRNQLKNMAELFKSANKELGENLSADIGTLSSDMSGFLDKLNIETSELNKGIKLINNNYVHIMEEMSQRHEKQIEQWLTSNETLTTNTQSAISTMICSVDKHLTEQSDESSRVINDSIKNSQDLLASIINKAQNMLQEQCHMLNELNSSVISRIKELLEEKLSLLIEQERNTEDMLNTNTDKYCQRLSESVIGFTNENVSNMIVSCENILTKSLKQIIEANENTDEKRSAAFGNYMNELKDVYNETITKHIKVLEEQIKNSVFEFATENKIALDKNNELTAGLITTENEFLSELEENNRSLRETIQNAFVKYSESVEENIIEFKNAVIENISENADNTKECIGFFAGENKETIEILAEKLRNYSDSFVDKSAQAIANVQADNNAKLQELCGRVSVYAQENSDFIVHCKEVNDAVGDNITNMIQDRDELINNMKSISSEHIESLDIALKSNVIDMNKMLQKVNIENSSKFSETMVDYRDKFVEANAEALAAVQNDNVSSITEANKKIVELSKHMKKFSEDVVKILEVLNNEIKEGLKEQAENSDNYHDKMDDLFSEKLSDYNSKIKKYNDIFSELSSRIQAVINVCESNTSKYNQTLELILNSQKESNSLNKKDIELLQSLMKR